MRRDMDLARELLLKIEEATDKPSWSSLAPQFRQPHIPSALLTTQGACCPADLSAVAESPAKFEARPLS